MPTATQGSTLADVLERVLDKGIVIAGDISVSVGSTELLSIRIRLLISSVDKAREIGINWWESDPYLSRQAQPSLPPTQATEVLQLQERIQSLETELRAFQSAQPQNGNLQVAPTLREPDAIDTLQQVAPATTTSRPTSGTNLSDLELTLDAFKEQL